VSGGELPGLLGSYARAVAGALPLPWPTRGDGGPPPRTATGLAVDLRHLAAYDRVCGLRFGDVLPATYVHVRAFPLALALMTGPGFPFGVLGLVHVRNRIEVLRPIRVSDTFDVSVRAGEVRDHDAGRTVDVIAEASVGGETAWRGISTYLHRERRPTPEGGEEKAKKRRRRAAPPPPSAVWRVPADIGRRYAEVSGDRNPIHLHPLTAKAFGMPGAIAHGMWVKARCLGALEGVLPETFAIDVEFKAPMVLPARVAFSSRPARRRGVREIGVHDARSGKPHLVGRVEPV
jgi:acyl dehydratase